MISEFLTFLLHRSSWEIQIQVYPCPCELRRRESEFQASNEADLRWLRVDVQQNLRGRRETDDGGWRLELPGVLDGVKIHRAVGGRLALVRACRVRSRLAVSPLASPLAPLGSRDWQPVRLASSYRCWFVYVREKYCWLVRVNNIFLRGLASQPSQPLPADQSDYYIWPSFFRNTQVSPLHA